MWNLQKEKSANKKEKKPIHNITLLYTTFLRINDYEGTNTMNFCRVRKAMLTFILWHNSDN